MDVVTRKTPSSSSSSVWMLNPNDAPLFDPMADEFSDHWFFPIHSPPSCRWIRVGFQYPQIDLSFSDYEEFIRTHLRDCFKELAVQLEKFEFSKDLAPSRASKRKKARTGPEAPRFAQKPPKIVNVKVSPRRIHQPR